MLPPRDAEDGGRVLVTLARHVVLEEAPATSKSVHFQIQLPVELSPPINDLGYGHWILLNFGIIRD